MLTYLEGSRSSSLSSLASFKSASKEGNSAILWTTSRRPSMRVRTFCNELARMIPNSARVNRGKTSLNNLAEKALEKDANHVAIIEEWQGNPGKISLYHVTEVGLSLIPPRMVVHSVKLQKDFVKQQAKIAKIKGIVKSNETERHEAAKLASVLSGFMYVPELPMTSIDPLESQNVITVSLDSFVRIKLTFTNFVSKTELGPRITLSKLIWGS